MRSRWGKKWMQSTIRCHYFQKASGWCVPIGGKPIINLVGKSCRLEIIRRKLAGRKTLMSTPTSSAEENSLSVNAPSVKSALADLPAQIKGDTEKTAEKLEELISELQEMIEFLRSESNYGRASHRLLRRLRPRPWAHGRSLATRNILL